MPSVTFERGYRMYGAVTALDQHQRFGNYFDFFWRARRTADVHGATRVSAGKVARLRAGARSSSILHARGHHKTEFAIIGDDFFDDGRVIAWRASLIVDGRIVATTRSYLWE